MLNPDRVSAEQDTIQISFGRPLRSYALADILPQRFGPGDLLTDANVPLLLQPQWHDLVIHPRSQSVGDRVGLMGSLVSRATEQALEAAKKVRHGLLCTQALF